MPYISHVHLFNAWILAIPVWLIGIAISSFNRQSMKRATDMSWYKPIDKISSFGSLFSLIAFLVVSLFINLKIDSWFFLPGIAIVFIGAMGHYSARISYMNAKKDSPAISGVYKISRNPMYAFLSLTFLGISFASKSAILLCVWLIMATFSHLLIVGEERYCLETYGESYRTYMKKVPRYFLFL